MIVSTVVRKTCVRKVRKVFVSKCKVWKLKEVETRKRFQEILQTGDASRVENDIEGLWTGLRGCLLEAADMMCGRTKGPPGGRKLVGRMTRCGW